MNREEVRDSTEPVKQDAPKTYEAILCELCGRETIPLHLGCRLCEDCCDCRPSGS